MSEKLQRYLDDKGQWAGPRVDYKFEIKKVDESGEFEGFASTTRKDLVGDIIEPGAFKRSINARSRAGKPFPVLWQHFFFEPIGAIKADDMQESEKGLFVKGRLVLSIERAREARDLAKEDILGGMSIGFTIPRNKAVWDDDAGVRRIKEVKLWEVSLVTFPANPGAIISDVKMCRECHQDMIHGTKNTTCSECTVDVSTRAIPYHEAHEAGTIKSVVHGWDVDAATRDGEELGTLKAQSAWHDESASDGDPAYRLVHHRAYEDNAVVFRGVCEAMGTLLEMSDDEDAPIPKADRKGAYDHLAKHLTEFDGEVPEFRSYSELELRGLRATWREKALDLEQKDANSVEDLFASILDPEQPAESSVDSDPDGVHSMEQTLKHMDLLAKGQTSGSEGTRGTD